jgi:hypothetical protein
VSNIIRSHCQTSPESGVKDQPKLCQASGDYGMSSVNRNTTRAGGSPGNRTRNLRIKSPAPAVLSDAVQAGEVGSSASGAPSFNLQLVYCAELHQHDDLPFPPGAMDRDSERSRPRVEYQTGQRVRVVTNAEPVVDARAVAAPSSRFGYHSQADVWRPRSRRPPSRLAHARCS